MSGLPLLLGGAVELCRNSHSTCDDDEDHDDLRETYFIFGEVKRGEQHWSLGTEQSRLIRDDVPVLAQGMTQVQSALVMKLQTGWHTGALQFTEMCLELAEPFGVAL